MTKIGVGRGGLIVTLSAWTVFSLLLVWGALQASGRSSAAHEAAIASVWRPDAVVNFSEKNARFVVPSWKRLEDSNIWAHVWKQHSFDAHYQPPLVDISGVTVGTWVEDKRVHSQILSDLQQFMHAAEAAGHPVLITSAFRSYADQEKTRKDLARTNGQLYADEFVAEPGKSEHQSGLAIDFSSNTPPCQQAFEQCRLDDKTAAWLAAHAHEYGFILRYPPNKQHLTGVPAESWHYRYVGRELAGFMHQHSLTFEEVMAQLKQAKATQEGTS